MRTFIFHCVKCYYREWTSSPVPTCGSPLDVDLNRGMQLVIITKLLMCRCLTQSLTRATALQASFKHCFIHRVGGAPWDLSHPKLKHPPSLQTLLTLLHSSYYYLPTPPNAISYMYPLHYIVAQRCSELPSSILKIPSTYSP